MSRFACPPEFSDQKIIWHHFMQAGDMAAGKGFYGLCNELWAFAGRIKTCVGNGHRYHAEVTCGCYTEGVTLLTDWRSRSENES